jgi:phenylacetate-CoA ligase
VLICTPSYALRIAEVGASGSCRATSLALKLPTFGGEPWTEDMRARIERELGILCFNNYGLSEVIGPGVSGECAYRTGMHIQEDHSSSSASIPIRSSRWRTASRASWCSPR